MPYVTNFIFKKVNNSMSKEPTERKILQAILLDSFPSKSSFSMQFSLVFENPYEEHQGYLEFYRPDGSLHTKTSSFIVRASQRPSDINQIDDYELLTGVAYEIEFNEIVFEKPGLYILKIYCDGSETAKFAITVAESNF